MSLADTENKFKISSKKAGKEDGMDGYSKWQNSPGRSRRFHGRPDETLHQYGEFISPDVAELEKFEEQKKEAPQVEAPQIEEIQAPVKEPEREEKNQPEPVPEIKSEPEIKTEPKVEVETTLSFPDVEEKIKADEEPLIEEKSEEEAQGDIETPSDVPQTEDTQTENTQTEETERSPFSFSDLSEIPDEGVPLGESFMAKLADLDKKFGSFENEEQNENPILEQNPEPKKEQFHAENPSPNSSTNLEPVSETKVDSETQEPVSEPESNQEEDAKDDIVPEQKESPERNPEPSPEPKDDVVPEQKENPAEEKKDEIIPGQKTETVPEQKEETLHNQIPEPEEKKNRKVETEKESTQPQVQSQKESPNLKSELKNIAREKKEIQKKQALEKKEEAKRQKEIARSEKVRHPIGAKLIGIITLIVLIAMGTVTAIVSYFITQDVRINAEENNRTINNSATSDCESRINSGISAARMFIDLLSTSGGTEEEITSLREMFFERHVEIIALYLPKSDRIFCNSPFLISREVDESMVRAYMEQEKKSLSKAGNGAFEILNASPFFNIPVLAFFTPIISETENSLGFLFSSEEMAKSISSGTINQSCLINNDGVILVHNDVEKMMSGDDLSENPLMDIIKNSAMDNEQTIYKDTDGTEYIGAFKKFGNGNGIVITTVKTDIVLEGIRSTTRRNIYITAAILALAILVIWFFSRSLSRPLTELTAVVNEINRGNFNTELFNEMETTKRKDEIGVLGKSTKNEREILNTFAKLTNKGVTKAIITKEIDFEPHLKDITIFFSDIRGFTAISDGFKKRYGEKSAAEIIRFLNDYMARMVSCIRNTGGVIDKFEGDAIMAAWGVLRNDGLDWENLPETSVTRALKKDEHDQYVKEDALNSIISSVAMRYSLMKYNKDAEAFTKAHEGDSDAPFKPKIRIGAGLNCGRVTVGFMGSFDKMEFTSIGDAVNLASRTEASNKACGTDVLMTQDMYDLLKTDFIKCEENSFTIRPENQDKEIIVEQIPVAFEVKGKGLQHFYGVVNMPGFDIVKFFERVDPAFELDDDCSIAVGQKGPKTLSDVRRILGIPEPDFAKVNLGEEENKVKVAGS